MKKLTQEQMDEARKGIWDAMIFIAVLVGLLLVSIVAFAGPLDDTNYCGPPQRNASGDIIRRADVLRAFQRLHPCPSTGLPTGACPGWAKDHVRPLACGGCDSVSNLQWLDTETKARKDRWERRIYDVGIEGTDACTVGVVQ